MSTPSLYIGAATAFAVAVTAASLAISYLACEIPYLYQVSRQQWNAHLIPLLTRSIQATGMLGFICADDHYKYLVPLLVPTTAWFVIANWVGWEYFRNA